MAQKINTLNFPLIMLFYFIIFFSTARAKFTDDDLNNYRQRVVGMFQYAYNGYLKHAYPYDELRPLSCDGVDTWGSFSLTLIDALDTLAVMGNYSEFRRVAKLVIDTANFNININVSVFETNIRVVGGLLSAHLLSKKAGMELEEGWPCSGPLLRLAEDAARRLLPAFQTKTGMPYGTVNLNRGVPDNETPITCTAGVATFLVEFGALSRLSGDSIFEETALNSVRALWKTRSSIGLVGNHIDVESGKWTAVDAGIGAGVDSFFEYLVKGAMLLQMPELMKMFNEQEKLIEKYMMRDDWYLWVSMGNGQITMPIFQSLEAFWPGLLTLVGKIDQAKKSLYNYHQIWKQYGFTPEFYDIPHSQANSKREGYPLRPEFTESVMYLYRATKDPHLLEIGVDILESIEHSAKTECGYATIKSVKDHKVEDRMESFFLAETTKYLYLLFSPDNFIHNNGSHGTTVKLPDRECILDTGGYVFNTEAHPVDMAAVYCCSSEKKAHDQALGEFMKSLDLFALLNDDKNEFLKKLKGKIGRKSIVKTEFDERMEEEEDSEEQEEVMHGSEEAGETPQEEELVEDITSEEQEESPENVPEETSAPSFEVDKAKDETASDITNRSGSGQVLWKAEVREITLQETRSSEHEADNESKLSENVHVVLSKDVKEVEGWNQATTPVIAGSDILQLAKSVFGKGSPADVLHSQLQDLPNVRNNYQVNFTSYEILSCSAQSFTSRLSLMGEMFNVN